MKLMGQELQPAAVATLLSKLFRSTCHPDMPAVSAARVLVEQLGDTLESGISLSSGDARSKLLHTRNGANFLLGLFRAVLKAQLSQRDT